MNDRKQPPDISVIIATCNRAKILQRTLENLCNVDRSGLLVQFVIVDNKSTDDTKKIIGSFQEKLPLTYLYESKPGKNVALNYALRTAPLGRIIAFTDDDVKPSPDWLQIIWKTTKLQEEYSIFGGKVLNIWDLEVIPTWAGGAVGLALPTHDHGDESRPYAESQFPAGANMWVKREVFDMGMTFDGRFGPRPKKRIMGSETSFVLASRAKGYRSYYESKAIVEHYLEKEFAEFSFVAKRAFRAGRSSPHLFGLKPEKLYKKAWPIWVLWRCVALLKYSFLYIIARLHGSEHKRIIKTLAALKGIGYCVESLSIAFHRDREGMIS